MFNLENIDNPITIDESGLTGLIKFFIHEELNRRMGLKHVLVKEWRSMDFSEFRELDKSYIGVVFSEDEKIVFIGSC